MSDVPHQVPPPPLRFVNRVDEIATTGDLLSVGGSQATRIAVLTGPPGVGKSALARRVVELKRGAYPGGELFVDFGAPDGGDRGTAVSDALGACLLALGVAEAVLPSRLTERAKLFRTRTSALPVLVVLDDVTEPAQVPTFLPNAPGSAVLVTSNARLTELRLDGADVVQVDPLDDAAAAQLLRELCGDRVAAEHVELMRLVAECGGLPVALRVAAARLVSRRGLTVRALVEEITDARKGLAAFSVRGEHTVAAVFSVAYMTLPAAAARLYRLLGAVPVVDFTLDLAAAVADVDPRTCADLLDEVVEAGLVQEQDGGRHRFHSLIGRHAAERAAAEEPAADRLAAARRAVGHLLERAAFADLAITGPGRYRCTPHDQILGGRENPFDKRRALDWMDGERPNLVMGIRVAVEHGWDDQAWQLAESATALYANRRYLVDWTETSELGAAAARHAGQSAAEARLRSFSSRAWLELGDANRARSELDTAFSLVERTRDIRLLASVHEMDGRYHEVLGDYSRALGAFRRSLELFMSVDDRRGEASLTYFIGCAYQELGEWEQARDILETALRLLRDVGDAKMEGRALIRIGRGLGELGRDEEAGAALEQALGVLVASGDLFHESWAHEALVDQAERAGDRPLARAHMARMVEIHTRLGSGRVEELRSRLAAMR